MKKHLFISVAFASILIPVSCLAQGAEPVSISVVASRAWNVPDTRYELLDKVPKESAYYWKINGTSMAASGPSPIIQAEGQAVTSTLLTGSGGSWSRKGVKLEKSKGRYFEVLLLFRNEGTAPYKRRVSKGAKLNIPLKLEDGAELYPQDFIFPGFSNRDLGRLKELQKIGLTVVTEFSGDIEIFIEGKGDITWALLQYDIPAKSKKGQIYFEGVAPIPVTW